MARGSGTRNAWATYNGYCEHCGKRFDGWYHGLDGSPVAKFCSDKCRVANHRHHAKNGQTARRATAEIEGLLAAYRADKRKVKLDSITQDLQRLKGLVDELLEEYEFSRPLGKDKQQ